MRDIKFRGMDIDGRWFYGNLAVLTENARHVKKGHYISNSVGMPFAYQVRPETVGQFTGMVDSDGNEVWDGDVRRSDLGRHFLVKYDVEHVSYIAFYNALNYDFLSDCAEHSFLIGNIHQNPELLTP